MLGVDGEFELDVSESAGSGGSGASSAGGGTAGGEGGVAGGNIGGQITAGGVSSGGLTAGGTASGGGIPPGPDAQAPCAPGLKACFVNDFQLCVAPDPSVGCGSTGCDRCLPPPGGYGVCRGQDCDFECFSGSVKEGNECRALPPPEGGGGAPGTGGSPNTCTRASDCPACGAVPGCCTVVPQGRCGCNFVWCVPT